MASVTTVNPFVEVTLENLQFEEILVNKYYVSFENFNENYITLTPSNFGIHLPISI